MSEREDTPIDTTTEPDGTGRLDRRKMIIAGAGVAGAAWVVPSIVSATAASAATTQPPVGPIVPGPNIVTDPNFTTP